MVITKIYGWFFAVSKLKLMHGIGLCENENFHSEPQNDVWIRMHESAYQCVVT